MAIASAVTSVRDSVTGALVRNVGDDANNAIRVNMVVGAVTVTVTEDINPVSDYRTSANLAASASVDLDGSAIGIGTTGKLKRILVSSSVPCKWTIIARDGAAETTLGIIRTGGFGSGPDGIFEPPNKEYSTLAYGDGDENFRVTVKNQWILAADVDITIFWDEFS